MRDKFAALRILALSPCLLMFVVCTLAHTLGLKTAFRLAVQQAREAAGYNESSQTASNAPVREMTTVAAPVVSV